MLAAAESLAAFTLLLIDSERLTAVLIDLERLSERDVLAAAFSEASLADSLTNVLVDSLAAMLLLKDTLAASLAAETLSLIDLLMLFAEAMELTMLTEAASLSLIRSSAELTAVLLFISLFLFIIDSAMDITSFQW